MQIVKWPSTRPRMISIRAFKTRMKKMAAQVNYFLFLNAFVSRIGTYSSNKGLTHLAETWQARKRLDWPVTPDVTVWLAKSAFACARNYARRVGCSRARKGRSIARAWEVRMFTLGYIFTNQNNALLIVLIVKNELVQPTLLSMTAKE